MNEVIFFRMKLIVSKKGQIKKIGEIFLFKNYEIIS